MSLDKLVEKWRAEAAARNVTAQDKNWAHWVRENEAGRAMSLSRCASELEGALQGADTVQSDAARNAEPTPAQAGAELPELPEPEYQTVLGRGVYSADQMRAYALLALGRSP